LHGAGCQGRDFGCCDDAERHGDYNQSCVQRRHLHECRAADGAEPDGVGRMIRLTKPIAMLRIVDLPLVRHVARLVRREDGSAAVELGLLLPIFMILLAGTIDYAAYVNNIISLNAATRGAVEWAKSNFPSSSTTVTCTSSPTGICKYGKFASGVS